MTRVDVFDVVPSPKSQNRLVIVPGDVSVNVTVNGRTPIVGEAEKFASGCVAAVPTNAFVESEPLLAWTITLLLKAPAESGAKVSTRFVEVSPGRLNGVPDEIVNGPPSTMATPLLNGASPLFEIKKLACELLPTATVPKFTPPGETTIVAWRHPVPLTELLLFPPLLVKTTWLVELIGAVGLKVTETMPVWPGSMLKGVPLCIVNGGNTEAEPLSGKPPEFTTSKASDADSFVMTGPKLSEAGETLSCGGRFVTIM